MNIKELEFVRDFHDHLCSLYEDLLALSISFENSPEDEEMTEIPNVSKACLSSICHQAELMKSLFLGFKGSVDKAYWSEWKKLYPDIRDNYDEKE